MIKIKDDEQEKGKDRDWSGLKADVFSIELEGGNDKGLQLRMILIDEFRVLMLYLTFSFHILSSTTYYNHASIYSSLVKS